MQLSNIVLAIAAIASSVVSATPLEAKHVQARDASPEVLTFDKRSNTVVAAADIIKRDEESEKSRRNVGQYVTYADSITDIASDTYMAVKASIKEDLGRRREFTQQTVKKLIENQPGVAYVSVNTAYTFTGTLLGKDTYYYLPGTGQYITYDILAFVAGTFILTGDGGYENFALAVPGPNGPPGICTVTPEKGPNKIVCDGTPPAGTVNKTMTE